MKSQPSIVEDNLTSTSGTSSTHDEFEVTRKVLATLDNSYQSEFNHSFTESVVQHCKVLCVKKLLHTKRQNLEKLPRAKEVSEKAETTFKLFAKCHNLYQHRGGSRI